MSKTGYYRHETSFVDDGAEIGEGTRIWHFSHVLAGARVGRNCVIGQNVCIERGAVIGDGCKIQNNVSDLYRRHARRRRLLRTFLRIHQCLQPEGVHREKA